MSRYAFGLCIIALIFSACITLACGGSSRQIQSITVGPASADAQDYPNGQVAFVATGSYNAAPMSVSPLPANWAAQSEQIVNGIETFGPANGAVLIDGSGVAQCTAGTSGTYAVIAWDLQDPTLKAGCGSETDFGEPGCNAVQGTAQITCP
jgi:hypothetical protein